jgi:hypothetical protein
MDWAIANQIAPEVCAFRADGATIVSIYQLLAFLTEVLEGSSNMPDFVTCSLLLHENCI